MRGTVALLVALLELCGIGSIAMLFIPINSLCFTNIFIAILCFGLAMGLRLLYRIHAQLEVQANKMYPMVYDALQQILKKTNTTE